MLSHVGIVDSALLSDGIVLLFLHRVSNEVCARELPLNRTLDGQVHLILVESSDSADFVDLFLCDVEDFF